MSLFTPCWVLARTNFYVSEAAPPTTDGFQPVASKGQQKILEDNHGSCLSYLYVD